MPALKELCEKQRRGIMLVEDAACALGARINGEPTSGRALASAYSLHPRKAVTTGEGGMITTDDAELADLLGKLRNHGAESTDLERHLKEGGSLLPAFNMLGFNYRMTDLQGALGVAQMERVADVLAGRRAGPRPMTSCLTAQKPCGRPLCPMGTNMRINPT